MRQELTDERNARFLALLKPVYQDCQRWAYSLAQDVTIAEDILMESVLGALKNIHQLKNDDAFKTWFFRIITNNYRMWLRSNKQPVALMEQSELERVGPRDDEWAERLEQAEMVRRLVSKLSPEQREALVLFEVQGLSVREVSKVLGKKESAVRVLLHRARQRMRELLRRAGVSPFPKVGR
ncbi:RNA polymerase sigma factor [bacterium]|nr:RNA polymerase sigma factor [bacterium]